MSSRLDGIRAELDEYLRQNLNFRSIHSTQLVDAMRYAVLGGGKRIRGTLVVATAQCLGSDQEMALPAAASVEYMHAYSLVHDDLPDMDNAALRRGQASCHVAFGTTTAILAGDALQSLAFSSIADATTIDESKKAKCISALARAAGWRFMVGGQAMDMELQGAEAGRLSEVRSLAQAKTAALFRACVEMGGVIGGLDEASSEYRMLCEFGFTIGEAFQVVDDCLDATQSPERIGKPAQVDRLANKTNYVSVLGLEEARTFASKLFDTSMELLKRMNLDLNLLEEIAQQCIERVK